MNTVLPQTVIKLQKELEFYYTEADYYRKKWQKYEGLIIETKEHLIELEQVQKQLESLK